MVQSLDIMLSLDCRANVGRMRDEACPMSGTAHAEKGDPIYMGKVSKKCHDAREGFGVASRWEQSSFPVGSDSNPGGFAR